MKTRQARYHEKWRAALIAALGGRCVYCGATDQLELDHIKGRDYKVEAMSSHTRVKRYREEAARGELQVLCRPCNGRKGALIEQRGLHDASQVSTEDVPAWATE